MSKNKIDHIQQLYYARLQSVEFNHFRNIEHGKTNFPDSEIADFYAGKPSVLGIYGQNGSGKTSVIMALSLLKIVLSGKSVGNQYESCIQSGHERCTLKFAFALYSKLTGTYSELRGGKETDMCYLVEYSFDLAHDETEADDLNENKSLLIVENEILKIKIQRADGTIVLKKQVFFDTSWSSSENGKRAFGGKMKNELFTLFNQEYQRKYLDIKAITRAGSKSFLMSKDFINLFYKIVLEFVDNIDSEPHEILKRVSEYLSLKESNEFSEEELINIYRDAQSDEAKEAIYITGLLGLTLNILDSLRTYGTSYLHVIETSIMGQTSLNKELPLMLWTNQLGDGVYNMLVNVKMDEPSEIQSRYYSLMLSAVNKVSDALEKLIPDLTISVRDLGTSYDAKNNEVHRFEIVSCRLDNVIPLKYESDGVRRIVSIMSLLIAAYNDASFTVAIDELDTGIFEYLLGELLHVLSESIRGQLIFTSHNLRPLEVLPSKYLCFTTTDPNNRFTSLSKRGNNNLRDCYFRNIILGSDEKCLYKATDRYEIEMALRNSEE